MLTIRTCDTPEDIALLAKTAKEIWDEYFINIITQEQIDYMTNKFLSVPALENAFKHEHYTYYLAFEDDQMIGFCGVKPDNDRLFLSKLYVRKEYRGRRISSMLFQEALNYVRDHDELRAIYLTCNKYNENSLAIYKHKGFKTIDAVQTDIGHGFIMDDYIMQLDLK